MENIPKEENEDRSHAFDLAGEDGEVYPSSATAVRLFGIALEELDKKILWKMGGQIGGCRDFVDMVIHTNGGHILANLAIDFDAEVLRKYVDEQEKTVRG